MFYIDIYSIFLIELYHEGFKYAGISGDVDMQKTLDELKKDIEELREEINRYIEYPDIFKEEIQSTSQKIDICINEYLKLQNFR